MRFGATNTAEASAKTFSGPNMSLERPLGLPCQDGSSMISVPTAWEERSKMSVLPLFRSCIPQRGSAQKHAFDKFWLIQHPMLILPRPQILATPKKQHGTYARRHKSSKVFRVSIFVQQTHTLQTLLCLIIQAFQTKFFGRQSGSTHFQTGFAADYKPSNGSSVCCTIYQTTHSEKA